MKAIFQTGEGEIEIKETERPTPTTNEVLVKVSHAGLCGSDVHAYKLNDGFEWITIPRIMGHEYTGEVVELGEDVINYEIGDRVIEQPIHSCGDCFQCKMGEENVCQNTTITGMHNDGGYGEYSAIKADHLVKVPNTVSSEHAAITEPLSIAGRSVYTRSSVDPGDQVLVQGPGPIGTLIAALTDALGADVIVSGLGRDDKYRLPMLQDLGIETVNIEENDLSEKIDEKTSGIGMDTVFDSTGHKSGIESAIDHTRKGGEIIEVGLPAEPSEVFFTPVVRGEIDIKPSYGAEWSDFEQSVRILNNDILDIDRIIDTGYSTANAEAAFEDFLAGNTCKPVFSF